jgi:hypothetical protein
LHIAISWRKKSHEHGQQAGAENVVASRHAITMSPKGDVHVQLPLPLPCLTILLHGVNDVGEAYDAQETGLCAGLNARLNRARSGEMASPIWCPPHMRCRPQRWRKNARRASRPIRTLYISAAFPPPLRTDRYGKRLDMHGAKNGGPVRQCHNDTQRDAGAGFNGKVAGSTNVAEWAGDPLHKLKKAGPRLYMLLATKRLAMPIKIIRSNRSCQHVAINVKWTPVSRQ